MRVMQTRNRKLVLGILLTVLIVGFMLTVGQVPLAVSQRWMERTPCGRLLRRSSSP